MPVHEARNVGGTWDNGSVTKNGPNVTGALTPQSGPDPYEGGAMQNPTDFRPSPRKWSR